MAIQRQYTLKLLSEKALTYLEAKIFSDDFEEALLAVLGQKPPDVPLRVIGRDESDDWFLIEDERTGIAYTMTRNTDGRFPTPSELMAEIDEI